MRCFRTIFSRRCRRCISASNDTRFSDDASVDWQQQFLLVQYHYYYYYHFYFLSVLFYYCQVNLLRVMKAAARVVSETRKFDYGLTRILHDDLHWLDVADRVMYKLGVIMHRCRHGKAPQYLVNCCTLVNDVVGRQRLSK